MTLNEIKAATELLKDRCDRIESCGDDSEGGYCLTAYWLDGGQKVFHTIREVENNCDEYARRQGEAASETTICGKAIQHDNSGVGHNWRTVDANDLPANIVEEIAAEIIDGKQETCPDYVATNGLHYRW